MKRILVFDQDPGYREKARVALGPLACDIRVAESMPDALRAMREDAPAMVIAGADEPGEGDLELLRLARADWLGIGLTVLCALAFLAESAPRVRTEPGSGWDTGGHTSSMPILSRGGEGRLGPVYF